MLNQPQTVHFEQSGASNAQIAKNILAEYRESVYIQDMETAQNYYLVKNANVSKKSRSYSNSAGGAEYKTLANSRLPSAFLRLSVDQKINYAFGKPFVIEITAKDKNEPDERYSTEWQSFLTDEIRNTIARIAEDAVNKGIGWGYVYIDTKGQLQLVDVEPETVYPAWADKPHTTLDAVVRDYSQVVYEDETPVKVKKVEYWDASVVEKYIDDNGELIPDIQAHYSQDGVIQELPDDIATAHMLKNGDPYGWGRVPFIALKGNNDELPLLNIIKDYIDAYDMLSSKSVDTLLDDIDAVLVLKGYAPELGSLASQRQIIQNSRVVAVAEDGGAEYLTVKTDISAVQMKLEALYKNIMQFSNTVDTNDVKFGTNNSGIALKAMYQNLDIYCNGLEKQFRAFIGNLKYFFDLWLEYRGIGSAAKWQEYKVAATLDRDMLIDTTALIDQTVKLQGLVSQETLDNYNPAVKDHETEQKRREKEEELQTQQNGMYNLRKQILADEQRLADEE